MVVLSAELKLSATEGGKSLRIAGGNAMLDINQERLKPHCKGPNWLERACRWFASVFSRSYIDVAVDAGDCSDIFSARAAPCVPSLKPAVTTAGAQQTGLANPGNECYINSTLAILATVDQYRDIFSVSEKDGVEKALLCAVLLDLTENVRNGTPRDKNAMGTLHRCLATAGLIPGDLGIQHDASEFLCRMLDYFSTDDSQHTLDAHYTLAVEQKALRRFDGVHNAPIELDANLTSQPRTVNEGGVLNLPMPVGEGNFATVSLQALIDATMDSESDTCIVRWESQLYEGRPRTQMCIVNAPEAFSIAVKRNDGRGSKDERPLVMLDFLKIGDQAYRLTGVIYHQGAGVGSGHYVADTYDTSSTLWTHRNDINVTVGDGHFKQNKGMGHVYTYARTDEAVGDTAAVFPAK